MHGEESSVELSGVALVKRLAILLAVSAGTAWLGLSASLNSAQAISCSVFIAIIMGTLFFWNFRLAIAFIGLSVLILTNSLDIATFVESSALEVILFLVGMMIIVGALRDLGFFTWIVQLIVSMPNISGKKFIAVTAVASALLACAVDEVTSIIFISTLIFQVCNRLKLNPTPYIIICVLCTNVGSAGTMMGNPVGIYIGTKGGLTFVDFIIWAFPIMLAALALTVFITLFYFRRELREFDKRLKERFDRNLTLVPMINVPYKQGLILLISTVILIASHHQLEQLFNLSKNSILLIAPLICSGVIMIIRRKRARNYVEHEVDWWTLLFFMLLFAIAGTLEHTHVDVVLADNFARICGENHVTLVPFVLLITALGSAFVDNVIFVAAFCPVIEKLALTVKDLPLWWALLFGACFGGNITMIGSTANIVALGMLEKKSHSHIGFFQWFKIGALSAFAAGILAWGVLMLLTPFMPDRAYHVTFKQLHDKASRFKGKKILLKAEIRGESDLYLSEKFPREKFQAYNLAKTGLRGTNDNIITAYVERSSKNGESISEYLNSKHRYVTVEAEAWYAGKTAPLKNKVFIVINKIEIDENGNSIKH